MNSAMKECYQIIRGLKSLLDAGAKNLPKS